MRRLPACQIASLAAGTTVVGWFVPLLGISLVAFFLVFPSGRWVPLWAKYAVVASGNAEIYLRLPSGRRYVENIWDHAAGALLVEEAGGRVTDIDGRDLEEVSIGDYVLSGGEVAAQVLLDAVIRLLPGVMGNAQSGETESFEGNLLEHPHYTRPAEWNGRRIPDVLLSGNHAAIDAWRRAESERITRERRPDLWARRDAEGDD